jgi:2,3-dihydroxyphenylpropionate 1,2-dioxygenase
MHYPGIAPERVRLTQLLYWLANKPDERARYLADPAGYCATAGITAPEQEALAEMNQSKLLKLGIHPLVSFLAHLQVERERKPH